MTVKRNVKDWGPGTKYLGASNTEYTFICDDDANYSNKIIENLTSSVRKVNGQWPIIQNFIRKKIQGSRGLIIPPLSAQGYSAFLKKLPKITLDIDDETFQEFISQKNIPILTTPKFIIPPNFMGKGRLCPHALSKNKKRRKRAIQTLKMFMKKKHKRFDKKKIKQIHYNDA